MSCCGFGRAPAERRVAALVRGAKEAEAEPILAERDRAGRRLVQGLLALAAEADRLSRRRKAKLRLWTA